VSPTKQNKRQHLKGVIGFIIGLLGGCFGGLVGLGGGAVMIPLMTGLGHLTQHKAHGTSLAAIIFTALVGAATYSLHGTVNWKIAAVLAVSAILTARLGALYAHSLPERKLKRAFGIFLAVVSILVIVKGILPSADHQPSFWASLLIFITTGAATGFLSGMMGVGGGTVMIPPMVILAGISQHLAQGTSLLAMVPVSITGALTHYKLGNVEIDLIPGLVVGGLVGSYLGGTAANLLPELYLKIIFSAVLVWLALKYLKN
jgi:uncharacterized membrane protein YfcA